MWYIMFSAVKCYLIYKRFIPAKHIYICSQSRHVNEVLHKQMKQNSCMPSCNQESDLASMRLVFQAREWWSNTLAQTRFIQILSCYQKLILSMHKIYFWSHEPRHNYYWYIETHCVNIREWFVWWCDLSYCMGSQQVVCQLWHSPNMVKMNGT